MWPRQAQSKIGLEPNYNVVRIGSGDCSYRQRRSQERGVFEIERIQGGGIDGESTDHFCCGSGQKEPKLMNMLINKEDRFFVAGHRGMAGSAICRALQRSGYENLLTA